MSVKLTCADYGWSGDIQTADDAIKYDNGDHVYVLEDDLGQPYELHDLHSDYPLAPENMCVTSDLVSAFSNNIYSHHRKGKHVKDENDKT